MQGFIFLYSLLWSFSQQSELLDFLSTIDQLFEEFKDLNSPSLDEDAFKMLIRRSYNLNDERELSHGIVKRSLNQEDTLIRDTQGVYFLSNIKDVLKIPVRFPNDINVLSSHNLLYITTLEANGTNPEYQLANDLVLFQYSSIQGVREMGRVPVLDGLITAVYSFRNYTYIISAEHGAQYNPDLFQGSTVYKLVEQNGRVFLEKMQILNVFRPNDVKFWEHQDQLYLVVGTNMGNDSLRTGVLVYRWLGYHFDCLQVIPAKDVKSVTPFKIGSFMFLAVANFKDEYGNTDIYSEIYQFNLEEMKFKPSQRIKTHGARDFSFFKFEDIKAKKSEHFLIVANSLSKNSAGIFSSLTESVVYKFSDNYFIPFQSFKLQGATQWLPITGVNGEFLLLASCLQGVVGYQYDGWRFSEVSLQFGQSYFGDNIYSMKYFQYLGDIFLTIADKNSYGNQVNLWKLEFINRNDLEKWYNEIKTWCAQINEQLNQDKFDEVIDEAKSITDETPEESQIKGENLKAEDLSKEIRDELEYLTQKAENLQEELEEAEEDLEHYKNNSERPIIIDTNEVKTLNVNCDTPDCCTFNNLKVLNINNEKFPEFLSETVLLGDDVSDSVQEFEHVVVKGDLSSSMVNGHPAETLIDVSSTTLINANLFINGTVYVNGNLLVNGLYDGIASVQNQLLLKDGFQDIKEKLMVDSLKVKNLELSGLINSVSIEQLLRQPELDFRNSYNELNVNNIFVEGLVSGYNVTQVFDEALKSSGDQDIYGNFTIKLLEAPEVVVDSDEISSMSISEIMRAYEYRLCVTEQASFSENNPSKKMNFKSAEESETEFEKLQSPAEHIIIVEGFLKSKDIFDSNKSVSLLNVFTNSYKLNDTKIESNFEFSNLIADNLEVDIINGLPVSSWVLKSSNDTQYISGRKTITNFIQIREEASADRINGINLKEFEKNVLKLDEYQVIPHDLQFDTIKCLEIETNFTNLGLDSLEQIDRIEVRQSIITDRLQVENLTLYGDLDTLSWTKILEDSIFDPKDIILGEKTIQGPVQVKNLNVEGRINDLLMDEFVVMTSKDANKILFDTNVKLNSSLIVEELQFEGFLNSILMSDFEHEWLLQDGAQIITGPIYFENVDLKMGCNLMNETINNISLRKLFTKSVKLNEDTKIKYLFGMDKVRASRIDINGTLNGADFENTVVRSKSNSTQEIFGEWFLGDTLTINGHLVINGSVSGLNFSLLCGLDSTDKVNLTVGGSVQVIKEPKVKFYTNGIDLIKKAKEVWMTTENITLKGQQIKFENVEFENKTTLTGYLNNFNLTDLSKYYLSKTQNRVVSAEFEFDQLAIENSCRMHTARVGGTVNGVDLSHWAKNVLLQDEQQTIEENIRFAIFQASELHLEGTVNGLNLSRDILRMDVEEAVVEGETTFQGINVLNLTLASGKTLQGVDIDTWRNNLVKTVGDYTIKEDLIFEDADFNKPLTVGGKVNDIYFDSKHVMTINGNQVVTGEKWFNSQDHPDQPIKIRSLEVSGLIDGVNLDDLIKNQAYSNKNLVFTQPKTFNSGLTAEMMEVDGLFQGVNISGMCHDVFNPVNVNSRMKEFNSLLNQTTIFINVIKDRAFFFDYFELIQTLKPNIKAVVPTIDLSYGNYLLAVITPKMMKFMNWNEDSESFTNTDEGLNLSDNVTFVTSETFQNRSLLYIETTKSAKIFEPQFLKEIESTDTSCVSPFQLKPLNKSCIFIGQKWNSSRILCNSFLMNDLQTYQRLESKGSVQVTTLNIDDEIYIAVINKEEVFDKIENTLSIYRFDQKLQHFHITHTLAEVNPVAVSSISYKNDHYLVSAGGHLPESVHNSVLSIFKFNKHHKVFIRSQSIRVDTPVDVHFALLPSFQLALYVLTSNPTKPFVVFLHKGISGFVEETSGLSLYPGTNLYSFTDSRKQHFVVISGFGRGQILKAGFKGNK